MIASICQCGRLESLAIVRMGHEEGVFDTLEAVRKRGLPWWWLYASTCKVCEDIWLVAQEEHLNNLYILRRLDSEETGRLLVEGVWPTDFDRYETLLEIGRATGHSVRFLNVEDSPLLNTVSELARERPGISVTELAMLLNLDLRVADALARDVVRTEGVDIAFITEENG